MDFISRFIIDSPIGESQFSYMGIDPGGHTPPLRGTPLKRGLAEVIRTTQSKYPVSKKHVDNPL